MYPSQNLDQDSLQSPKRKRIPSTSLPAQRRRTSALPLYGDIQYHPIPQFQIVNDTDVPNGKSLDVYIVRDWRQFGNTWTERARSWSQQENHWYKKMQGLNALWNNDPNPDVSKYPTELIYASMKLDQAMKEVVHCKKWIAYAKWQVASRTGEVVVGECPSLPCVDGRPPMVYKDTLPRHLEEVKKTDEQIKAEAENGNLAGTLPKKTATKVPVGAPQAPMQGPPRKISQEQQGKVLQLPFQNPTVQAPTRAFVSTPVAPPKALGLVSRSPAETRIKAPQTPARDVAKALPQPFPAVNDPARASVQPLSRAPVQAAIPLQRAHAQGSVQHLRGSVQVPISAPLYNSQASQASQAPEAPISQQQYTTTTQDPHAIPLLSFEEFVVQEFMQQPPGRQLVGQPVQHRGPGQQPMQQPPQHIQSPTQKLTRAPSQNPTQQLAQKPGLKLPQKATQPVGQLSEKPIPKPIQGLVHQPTSLDPPQNAPNRSNSSTLLKKASSHKTIASSAEPSGNSLPPNTNPNTQAPTQAPTVPSVPSVGSVASAEINSGVSTPAPDWWDTWMVESELDAAEANIKGEELERLMEDLAGSNGVDGSGTCVDNRSVEVLRN